MKYYELNLST